MREAHRVHKSNKVNHPEHYNKQGRKECIQEMEEQFGTEAVIVFCVLNWYKYNYRHDLKGGEEDLQKAKWYFEYAQKLRKKVQD